MVEYDEKQLMKMGIGIIFLTIGFAQMPKRQRKMLCKKLCVSDEELDSCLVGLHASQFVEEMKKGK